MSVVSKSSAYAGSVQAGIPRLTPTPEGWVRAPLSKFLHAKQRPIKMKDDAIYRLVTVRRSRGGVVLRERLKGREISVKSQYIIREGDFLISKRQIVHGACGLVPSGLDGSIVSNEYAVLRGGNQICLRFLNHLAHSVFFQQTCFHSSIGVHIEKMIFKLDRWLKWEFNLPPLHEQERIAELLSTWDEAIETTEELIAASQAQKKAVAQRLLTGKRRLPGFSAKWNHRKLGEVADLSAGGTPATGSPNFWGGSISWMSSGEINLRVIREVQGRISQEGLENSSAKLLPKNSVLVALAGQGKTRGKVAINKIPLCTNQSVAAILPKQELDAEYLFHNLDSRYAELRTLSLGDGGRGGLNLSILKKISIPLPEKNEQEQIGIILSKSDDYLRTLIAKRDLLKKEKSALMQQILSGKRRIKIDEEQAAYA